MNNRRISGFFKAALLMVTSTLPSSHHHEQATNESEVRGSATESTAPLPYQKKQTYDIRITDRIGLSFDNSNEYFQEAAAFDHADAIYTTHNGSKIPKELRRPAHLLQITSGVPHDAIFMIVKAESNFKPSMTEKKNVTTLGYFQFNRDTTYETIKKTAATPWENLFLVSSLIEVGTYRDGRKRLHIADPANRGKEDRELTLSYHNKISKDFFSQGLLATMKIAEDYKRLKKAKIEPTHLDMYAKWFYGSGAGQEFSVMRRKTPDEPIWKIYGNDIDKVMKGHSSAINHPVNKNLYYTEDGTFKTITQTVDYLKTKKGIKDEPFVISSPDRILIEHITIDGKPIIIPRSNKTPPSPTEEFLEQDQNYKEAKLEI